jgi:predicted transcriptional regulator
MKHPTAFEPLGELESSVMAVAWSLPTSTAREVCDRLTGRRERAYTTIMTTMDRLHRKGLLQREKDGQAWRYRPTLSQVEFERALADGLALEILASHGAAGLAAFVDAAARVDEELLDQLTALIEKHRRPPANPKDER